MRYRAILIALFLPLLCHLIFRSRKDGGWRYFKERLGFTSHKQQKQQPRIWIHAASVGEVITVLPLIERLQQQQTDNPVRLLITTNTATGARIVADRINGDVIHSYLPMDYAFAVKRFFNRHAISEAWIVETEIWPWLFNVAKQKRIGINIINARLSTRSLEGVARFFKTSYVQALTDVNVLAKSETEVEHFTALGAQTDLLRCIGNLKFAAPSNQQSKADSVNTVNALPSRAFFLAASTHDDEEIRLAQAWLESGSNTLLVIVPRHAERGPAIAKGLSSLLEHYPNSGKLSRRSQAEQANENDVLFLADTMGELNAFYAQAIAVFVGGSLIDHGGHNMLEAARLSKPIISGSSTYNFNDEVQALKDNNAICIANNEKEVVELLQLCAIKKDWANALGERANNVASDSSQIVEKYLRALNK